MTDKSRSFERVLNLLEQAQVEFEESTEIANPQKIKYAAVKQYSTKSPKLKFWIFGFENQKSLDAAKAGIEKTAGEISEWIETAQNGQFLLVVESNKNSMRTAIKLLQAFSGEE